MDAKPDRLSEVIDSKWRTDSLVGSFFHSGADPGWQGCVVAEPQPGIYLVELFEWFVGSSSCQLLVRAQRMIDEGWQFYDTAEWMNNTYQHSLRQQWEHERAEQNGAVDKESPL